MKLSVNCAHCNAEMNKRVEESPNKSIRITEKEFLDSKILVDIVDDNIYHFQCNKGHDNIIYLDNPKFEILFESGINAMLDGYFAESVLTIAASIERTYEFVLEIITRQNEIPTDLYTESFNLIAKQSERQIGAFYFLYLNTIKRKPPVFSTKNIEFRNNVIHKGYIPKRSEVNDFARNAFNFIKQIFIDILENLGEQTFMDYQKMKYQDAIPKLKNLHSEYSSPRGSMARPTILCHMLVLDLYKKINYDSQISGLIKLRSRTT